MVGLVAQLGRVVRRRSGAESAMPSSSIRERLNAWWHGQALPPNMLPDSGHAPSTEIPDEGREPREESEEAPAKANLRTERLRAWSPDRIDVCAQLWGQGFISPGGAEYILQLAKPLALDPSMSVADLGAGLGGAGRTMAEEFGAWVTGYESAATLIERGSKFSEMAGFAKKASIRHFDPEVSVLNRRYDCFFSKENIYTISDKKKLFKDMRASLKPNGQILFTDYVLEDPDDQSASLRDWMNLEPSRPHLWRPGDMVDLLKKLDLDVRIQEDISEEFLSLVVCGWGRLAKTLVPGGGDRAFLGALIDEAELWVRRYAALESGSLRVYRFYAVANN